MNRSGFSAHRAFVAALCLSSTALADIVNIDAKKDNTLYEDPLGGLSNGAGQYFFVGETRNNGSRRGVLSFNVAANVPAGAIINSVSLTLHCSRTTTGSRTVSLHRLLADWGEGTSDAGDPGGSGANPTNGDATWLHRFWDAGNTQMWVNAGGDYVPVASNSTTVGNLGYFTWNSNAQTVADVQSWLDNPAQNFGWLLFAPENGSASAKRFDSRENLNPAFRPQLIVNYTVPEPLTITLSMGLVAIWLTAARRR